MERLSKEPQRGVALRVKFAVCSCTNILVVFLSLSCGDSSSSTSNPSNSGFPPATASLVKLSTDTFTNSTSQHATEVEPGSFSFGSTIITSFQVGRIHGGGGADLGYATSTDGGVTWTSGFLPGITTFQGNGTNSAVSDTNVAYYPNHGVWLISSLPLSNANVQVAVSRSTDGYGFAWGNPIVVAQSPGLDKDWLVCDTTISSPHYGSCYMEWDDNNNGNLIQMSTSTDGGQTWTAPVTPTSAPHGLGGQPLVQPNGTVVKRNAKGSRV